MNENEKRVRIDRFRMSLETIGEREKESESETDNIFPNILAFLSLTSIFFDF